MKKNILAFLYNIWHKYPDPNDPMTQLEADFDDPGTIKMIINYLERIGFKVIPIEANEKAYLTLFKNKKNIDFAFDFSFGLYGSNKYGHIPAILEMLQIPFTSSSSFTRILTLNKGKMKEVLLANNLSTLPFQIFNKSDKKRRKSLNFPLIVKPLAQGSSAGILENSVVNSDKELERQVDFIVNTFGQPALVEPFLKWREFSVSMMGNPPRILPIIEPDYAILPKNHLPLDSLDIKWVFEEKGGANHLVCPAEVDSKLRKKIANLAFGTWKALDIKDLCRIDMRTDLQDNVYVLDVNAPPGLIPPEVSKTSYFPLAARTAGIDYKKMLRTIIREAGKRYNLTFNI